MVSVKEVKEGSTSYHALAITAKDGTPVQPEGIRYKLTGMTKKEIISWTEVPADTLEIKIPGVANTIGAAGGDTRFLTIEVTHTGGDTITSELEYKIINLVGVG